MIKSFMHKGLKRLFEDDDARGVNPEHTRKLRGVLTLLDAAESVEAVNFPGWRLHQLKGERAGVWSITVRANWRVTFRFENSDAHDLNYEDYH